jgi:ribulose-phosphate 3-epimerase
MAIIAPSLLASNFARVGEALQMFKKAGASMLHVDVMDGHFVPDISVGQPVIKSLRQATDLVLDLHLLIERPERYIKEFASLGADRIAIHAEATPNVHQALGAIRNEGAKAGLALNASSAVESVADVLETADYVLLLSSDLGFADSPFLPGTLGKLKSACTLRRDRGLSFAIQVEGSIGFEQVPALVKAGADILVAGSNILKMTQVPFSQIIRQAASAHGVLRI